MQQPIIQALRRHGLSGGLVYLNPTEPFNLYLEVGFVAGTIRVFTIRVLSIVVVHRPPDCTARKKRYVLPILTEYGWPVHRRRPCLVTRWFTRRPWTS